MRISLAAAARTLFGDDAPEAPPPEPEPEEYRPQSGMVFVRGYGDVDETVYRSLDFSAKAPSLVDQLRNLQAAP